MFGIGHFRHFEAVYRLRSFIRASEEQNVTQSALTKSIKQMESILGAPLFDRTTRTVHPTELGNRLIHHAAEIIVQIENFNDEAEHHQSKRSGRVAIGSGAYPMQPLLTDAARSFARINPDIRITLETGEPQALLDKLTSRRLDLIVCDVSKYEMSAFSDRFELVPLAQDNIVFVHTKDHPITGERLTFANLAKHRWAAPNSSPHFTRMMSSQQKAAQIKGDAPHFRFDTTAACVEMAHTDNVLAVVPQAYAVNACKSGALSWTSPPGSIKTNDAIHFLKDRTQSPAVREFVKIIKETAKTSLATVQS